MIQNLVTSLVLATSIGVQNATIQNQKTSTTNILTQPTPVTKLVIENDTLKEGTYYYIKTLQNDLPLTYASVIGKGYQRTYVNITTNTIQQEIVYIFKINYEMTQIMTFNQLKFHLLGQTNNTTYEAYYQDYYLYEKTQTAATIENFLNTDNLSIIDMNAIYNISMTSLNVIDYVDTVSYNTNITLPNEYKYIKFKLVMDFEGLPTADNVVISQLVASTQQVYRTVSSTFTWNVETSPTDTYEVIDLPGLFFTILGMPFAWLSTAFNVTFFPGTPYAVNVSHILLVLVASLILIVIIKKVLK